MLLVSGATADMRRIGSNPHLGYLCVPGEDFRAKFLTESGFAYAADNGCFVALDRRRFLKMLGEIAEYPRKPIFVTAPDVVADATETLRRFAVWGPVIRELGLPVALVGQDGLTSESAPWGQFDALFVGGSTGWKLGRDAMALVDEAKQRGLWVHLGRCNSFRRAKYAEAIGCDSIDGSKFSRFATTYIPKMVRKLNDYRTDVRLF
jgi:hypothetical protein